MTLFAVRHGLTDTPTHRSWMSMRQRCLNPKNRAYKNYGGRGISICERWNSFENFLADMGAAPPGYELDRIDVNGNYEPSNCRWATMKEQSRNRRSALLLTYEGRTQCLSAWAEELGIKRHTLYRRVVVAKLPLAEAFVTTISRPTTNTGFPGIYQMANGRFRATIRHERKTVYIGKFATIDAARQAYDKKSVELRGVAA